MSKQIKNLEQQRDKLFDLYHQQQFTLWQIAHLYKRHVKTIYRWLLKLNIRIRTSGESRKLLRSQAGYKNYHWKGFYIHGNGYKIVYDGNHKRVLEHRLIMKNHLGRALKKEEVVHHKNGNRLDNRIANLEVLDSQSSHLKEHAKHDLKWGFRGYTKRVGDFWNNIYKQNKQTLTELANETYEHYCQRIQSGATPFTNYEILTEQSYKSYIDYVKKELAEYD